MVEQFLSRVLPMALKDSAWLSICCIVILSSSDKCVYFAIMESSLITGITV